MSDIETRTRAALTSLADEAPSGDNLWPRTHRRITARRRARRLTAATITVAIFVMIAVTAVVANSRHTSDLQVQGPPSSGVPTTTVSQSHLVSNLGKCPASLPAESMTTPVVRSLRQKLVPIAALNVRICDYASIGALIDSALLKPVAAARLEDETNRLAAVARPTACHGPPHPVFVVTFANDTQQVNVNNAGCAVSNGVLVATPTKKWLNDLAEYATTSTSAPATTTVSPSHIAAKLGPCPSTSTPGPMTLRDAGVRGLSKKLVPIIAVAVRVCTYQDRPDGSVAARRGRPLLAASQLEDETNRLQRSPSERDIGGCVAGPLEVFITFASVSQHVSVLDQVGCADAATNGVLYVVPTTKWRNDLGDYTLPNPGG